MSTFQTIVLGIFGFFIIAGLIVIATTKSRGGEGEVKVSLWGSAPSAEVQELAEKFFPKKLILSYLEIPAEGFDQALIEALAVGRGPDTILLPAELLLREREKLYPIPYANYTERQFKDTFIQAGDAFLLPEGIAALPFSTDPLLMYWNRDLFDAAGVASPPKFWDEFLLLAPRLSARDRAGNLTRSAVALGEYRNITNAKEILAALLLQSGSGAVSFAAGVPAVAFGSGAASVIDFYTEFSNPEKTTYSWNRAQPSSRQAFLSARLAVYFGFGSERTLLRSGNPNLNFDAGFFPSPRGAQIALTYGRITGVAILRTSRNLPAALQAAYLLTSQDAAAALSQESGLPPAHRALLSEKPTDAFGSVLYDSVIRSRGFLDPNPGASAAVFQNMIESITSGRSRGGSEALQRAEQELKGLIR